jgi:uncharacterized protein YcbK (DUF882 family)
MAAAGGASFDALVSPLDATGMTTRNAAMPPAATRPNILTSPHVRVRRAIALSRFFVRVRHNPAAAVARLRRLLRRGIRQNQRVEIAARLPTILFFVPRLQCTAPVFCD